MQSEQANLSLRGDFGSRVMLINTLDALSEFNYSVFARLFVSR